jgi:hypothetical protein
MKIRDAIKHMVTCNETFCKTCSDAEIIICGVSHDECRQRLDHHLGAWGHWTSNGINNTVFSPCERNHKVQGMELREALERETVKMMVDSGIKYIK